MKNRRLTPQEKKEFRYGKDWVLNVEYPHSFRKSWKDGMREENRHYRRKVKQKFNDLDNCEDAIKSIRLKKCQKSSCSIRTVKQRVETQLDKRRIKIAWNYFKQPYNSELHRQDFVNFLTLLTESNSLAARRAASELHSWLYPKNPPNLYWYYQWAYRHYQWLQNFFQDEPEWELRLKKWVNLIVHAK